MKSRAAVITLLLSGTALVGGCASLDSRYEPYYDETYYDGGSRYYEPQPTRGYDGGPRYYDEHQSTRGYYGVPNEESRGVIESIESTGGGSRDNAVAGTIIGGVVGGVLGHQIGSGTGNTVATVAGAVGGAVVGHQIGQGNADRTGYHVRIRFDSGSYQLATLDDIGDLRVGDRVRVDSGRIYRY